MIQTQTVTALSGVTSGAAAGATFGPWGAAIGAVVGGAMGIAAGNKANKAKKNLQRATAVQTEREQNAVEAQYRQLLREARIGRAGSLSASVASGISTSSLTTSALSSIGSQGVYNVNYLAEDRRLYSLYRRYMEKAGQQVNDYQALLATTELLPAITSSFKKTYDSYSAGTENEEGEE